MKGEMLTPLQVVFAGIGLIASGVYCLLGRRKLGRTETYRRIKAWRSMRNRKVLNLFYYGTTNRSWQHTATSWQVFYFFMGIVLVVVGLLFLLLAYYRQ